MYSPMRGPGSYYMFLILILPHEFLNLYYVMKSFVL